MDKNKLTMDILEKLSIKITKGAYPGIVAETKTAILSSNIQVKECKNNTRLLVVFTGSDLALEDSLKEVKKLRELGYTIDVALSENAEYIFGKDKFKTLNPNNIYTEKDKMNYLEIVQNIDAVIVPVATQNTAIKLSLGLQDGFIAMMLWQCLWQGKTIYMNMDDMTTHRGIESKSKMLLQMIGSYTDKLKRLGVKPLTILNFSETIHNEFSSEKISSMSQTQEAMQERVVITEKDILNRTPGEVINVPTRAIVTSLAQEAAKSLSIKIIRQ